MFAIREGPALEDRLIKQAFNVWAHGDYALLTPEGGAIIYGRSDATLNVGGVRIGTAEIYRQIETMAEIVDSVVVAQPHGEDDRIVLLLVLPKGEALTDALAQRIRKRLRSEVSPRHVPAVIEQIEAVPYTRSGKKVAVARLLRGEAPANRSSIANPESLEDIAAIESLGLTGPRSTTRAS